MIGLAFAALKGPLFHGAAQVCAAAQVLARAAQVCAGQRASMLPTFFVLDVAKMWDADWRSWS